jgi:hypothetical protein
MALLSPWNQTRRPKTRDCTGNSDLSELNTTLRMNRFERPAASELKISPDQAKVFFNASQSSSEFMSAVDLIRQPTEGCRVDRFVLMNNKKGTIDIERETRNLSSGYRQSDSQNMRATAEVLSEVNRERPSREVRKQATPKFHAPSDKRNSSVSRSTNCASFIGNHDYSLHLENALKSKELSAIGIQNEGINDGKDDNTRYTIALLNLNLFGLITIFKCFSFRLTLSGTSDDSENFNQNILIFENNEETENDEWKELVPEHDVSVDKDSDRDRNGMSLGGRKGVQKGRDEDDTAMQGGLNTRHPGMGAYQKPYSAGESHRSLLSYRIYLNHVLS